MKGLGSSSREGRLPERRVCNHLPSYSECEPYWVLPQALDLGKGERLQPDTRNARRNQPDRDQLLGMAGQLAAGKERGLGRRHEGR